MTKHLSHKRGLARMSFLQKKSGGFTLIELLVVIAIIGILSSVVLASLNSARIKARDARRVADLKQIEVAEELYYDANSAYAANVAALVTGGQMPAEPKDPASGNSYAYATKTVGGKIVAYHVGADMEQAIANTTLDAADQDMVTTTALGWAGGPASGGISGTVGDTTNCAGTVGAVWCYDISNVGTP